MVKKSRGSRSGTVHRIFVFAIRRADSLVDRSHRPTRPNFRPKFPSDRPTRPGRTETQELPRDFFGPPISGHPAGGVGSSARPKFRGQCARSALRKCEFSAERPYKGHCFGQPSGGHRWDNASARKFSRFRRRTQPREKSRAELPAKVPVRPENPTRSDRNGRKFRVTFFGPPFSAHLAGGSGSSARPKFLGQCARSAFRTCDFFRGMSL
jgi:hypothetical protein